jgi:hypothetical protein
MPPAHRTVDQGLRKRSMTDLPVKPVHNRPWGHLCVEFAGHQSSRTDYLARAALREMGSTEERRGHRQAGLPD